MPLTHSVLLFGQSASAMQVRGKHALKMQAVFGTLSVGPSPQRADTTPSHVGLARHWVTHIPSPVVGCGRQTRPGPQSVSQGSPKHSGTTSGVSPVLVLSSPLSLAVELPLVELEAVPASPVLVSPALVLVLVSLVTLAGSVVLLVLVPEPVPELPVVGEEEVSPGRSSVDSLVDDSLVDDSLGEESLGMGPQAARRRRRGVQRRI